jgi:hypothetical protein
MINLTEQQRELARLMTDISERCWCAGWLMGLEYALWSSVVRGKEKSYGVDLITCDDIRNLKELSQSIGGWIRWDNERCEVFVPTAEWLNYFEDYQDGNLSKFGGI